MLVFALFSPLMAFQSAPASAAPSPFEVATGKAFTCVLEGGRVSCWGANANGQLGDGTTTPRSAPTPVAQGSLVFTKIAAGEAHACAVTDLGKAYCWGRDSAGETGTGTAPGNRLVPTAVNQGSTVFTDISLGWYHSCALANNKKAWCWGENYGGKLGDNTFTNRNLPVAVSQGAVNYNTLSLGEDFACALDTGGQTWCWGRNDNGRLGNPAASDETPVPLQAQQDGKVFSSIAIGAGHGCGLTSQGLAYCWGNGGDGQTGGPLNYSHSEMEGVSQGTERYVSLTAGLIHTCGVTSAGLVSCFGDNAEGQIGNSSTSQQLSPAATSQGGLRFSTVEAGPMASTTCAVESTTFALYCWGDNSSLQIVASPTTDRLVPTLTAYVSTSRGVTFSAVINPVFVFTVSPGSACNSLTSTAGTTSTANALNFGSLTSGTTRVSQDLSVVTNASNGFVVNMTGSNFSSPGYTIQNAQGSNATPTAALGSGSRFGYTTALTRFSGGKFAALSTTQSPVLETASTSGCVSFQAVVDALTPAGTYSSSITYTAIPTF